MERKRAPVLPAVEFPLERDTLPLLLCRVEPEAKRTEPLDVEAFVEPVLMTMPPEPPRVLYPVEKLRKPDWRRALGDASRMLPDVPPEPLRKVMLPPAASSVAAPAETLTLPGLRGADPAEIASSPPATAPLPA